MTALGIVLIAVLGPILLVLGILYVLYAAQLGASGIALNLLAATLGTLRFALDVPGSLGGVLTVLFVFFLILALAANIRLSRQLIRKLSLPPEKVASKPAKATSPTLAPIPAPAPAPSREAGSKKRIQILSDSVWVLHNDWGDIRVFTVPPDIIEKNRYLPDSDQRFRITYDEDEEPLDDTYKVSPNFQILMPPEVCDRLQSTEFIRFEIVK